MNVQSGPLCRIAILQQEEGQVSLPGQAWRGEMGDVFMLIANENIAEKVEVIPAPINVAGAPVMPFNSYDQALACIDRAIEAGRKTFWVAINPQKCYRAWHERELLDVLNRADVGICDGVGVSIAAKVLCGQRLPRVTGCDLFFRLLAHAVQRDWGVFMLGASAESNASASEKLCQRFPGLRIVGRQDGFFEDSDAVIDRINASKADLLFVAMGSPTQEYWICEHRDKIDALFCMGVGGSFDVASGRIKRAPAVFRKTGTEWLFQLLTEPHKRFRRQTIYVPFMLRVLSVKLSGSNGSTQWSLSPTRQ